MGAFPDGVPAPSAIHQPFDSGRLVTYGKENRQ